MKRYLKKNQKGFTLIEIIAVLIILGILATIAIGKFMDLQGQAQEKALQGAVAEGVSTCNICFGKLSLSNGAAPGSGAVATCATANSPDSTDFTYTFSGSDGSGGVMVTAANAAWGEPGSLSRYWNNPNE